MLWCPVECFGGLFVWIVSCLGGDMKRSPQFQKVHHPLLLPITDRFPQHQYCPRCLSTWCLFVLDDLWNIVECFQQPCLLTGKVWVLVIHFCACSIHCRECIGEGRRLGSFRFISVQPFDRVNYQGILYKLCSVGIGGSVLYIQFLSNRSQDVMVDGCHSKLVNVVSGVPQGIVLFLLLFLLYTLELFSILENKLIG